jgi:polysaccharide biosynthesis protein PelD
MKAVPLPDERTAPIDEDRCDILDNPRAQPSWRAGLEITVLAALGTVAAVLAGVGLPALALAPLLAGLRYGAAGGIACAALQCAALFAAAHSDAAITAPTGAVILGWLIAGLVPGQFCDAWTRRVRHLEQRARDASLRLGALARAYHVAIASHDQLQRELPGSPASLRDALEALARELDALDARAIGTLGERMLTLLRAHAAVRAASLHPVDSAGRIGPAVAMIGLEAAQPDDPLLREAVRRGDVVSVRDLPLAATDDLPSIFGPRIRAERGTRNENSSGGGNPGGMTTLVAIPLVDVTGRVHAVVAVHDLPFLFLHHDTLTLFAVLGAHLGDVMARLVRPVDSQATRAFCTSVSRALGQARRHAIPGALAVVELAAAPGEHPPRLLACFLAAQRRITDQAEVIVGDDGIVRVVVLLALAGAPGLRSYLARLDELARARARELGVRVTVRLRGWSLHDAPLPRDPRELAASLVTLLGDADPSSETSASRRRHGLVA